MTKPFRIFIDGEELTQYTGASLSRKKADLTGSLQCEVFFNYMPSKPVLVNVLKGKQMQAYVGNRLAFSGTLDSRRGRSKSVDENGIELTSSIEPNAYNVSLSARGQTKYLIEASHQIERGMLKETTTRQAAEALLKPMGVELVWEAEDVKLDRAVFRDGNAILKELQRIGNENGHYFYETKDGKLKFEDRPSRKGVDLVLGKNILRFSTNQSEQHDRSRLVVKGQRTSRRIWGEEALLNVVQAARKSGMDKDVPYVIQHYGDATKEKLEKRLTFEADKRNAQSLQVQLEVFHLQSQDGEPWDLGTTHYVEVPPEGIFNELEVIELEYIIDAQGTLKTALTLAPPPSEKAGVAPSSQAASIGGQRRAQLGANSTDFWSPSDLKFDSTFLTPELPKEGFFSLDGVTIGQPPDRIN